LREDHFIRGPSDQQALLIHCQRVLQSALRLHHKTPHLMAAVHIGATNWTVSRLLRDPKAALAEMVQAYRTGRRVWLLAYVLWGQAGEQRYIGVEKTCCLCFSSTSPSASAICWPKRSSEVFDSIFVTRRHMLDCIQAHGIIGDPIQSWQATSWITTLRDRMKVAVDAGAMLPACKALLLIEFTQASQPSLAGVSRLLHSEASRLEGLSHLNRCIHGVLHCTGLEEHRLKCNMNVVAKMFDAYRVDTIQLVGSDASCNFEALRYTLQSEFAVLFSQIREQGVLTADACDVLTAVDDALACILLSEAQQIVHSIPSVQRVLADHKRLK